MILIGLLSAYLNYRFQPLQATLSPCPDTGCVMLQVNKVEAAEPIKEPLNTYGAPSHIVDLIVKYFGDEAQNALKIVGTCENGKWNPTATNQNRNGTLDIGIFQHNVKPDNFAEIERLKNPEYNIKLAYKKFHAHNNTFYLWTCGYVVGHYTYLDRINGIANK